MIVVIVVIVAIVVIVVVVVIVIIIVILVIVVNSHCSHGSHDWLTDYFRSPLNVVELCQKICLSELFIGMETVIWKMSNTGYEPGRNLEICFCNSVTKTCFWNTTAKISFLTVSEIEIMHDISHILLKEILNFKQEPISLDFTILTPWRPWHCWAPWTP